MLKKTIRSRWLIPMLVLTLVGLLTGCGSEVNDDWDPITPEEARHPFDYGEHGEYLATADYDFSVCTQCHGETLNGVELGDPLDPVRACTACHRTDNHIIYFDNAFEHVQWLPENGYAFDNCYICHAPFDGSPDAPAIEFGNSCSNRDGCHDNALGALACNTCHGEMDEDPAVLENWAPDGEFDAHTTHLTPNGTYATFTCQVCHEQPSTPEQAGHYNDDTPGVIEMSFSAPARSGGFRPEYNSDTNTCSNVYCHAGVEVAWNTKLSPISCTGCHTYPPEENHPANDDCVQCHSQTVGPDADADGFVDIVAEELHINGTVNGN